MQNVWSSGQVPVYKLVLLQILAALGDVSGHVEKIHHVQAGRVLLITQRRDKMYYLWCGFRRTEVVHRVVVQKTWVWMFGNLTDLTWVTVRSILGFWSKMIMFTWAWCSSVSHQPRSGLPQERFEISSGHQLQQNEPGHGLQTDSYTTHNVLMAEFTVGSETQQGKEMALLWDFLRDRILLKVHLFVILQHRTANPKPMKCFYSNFTLHNKLFLQRMSWGEKFLRGLVVWQQILLYPLPGWTGCCSHYPLGSVQAHHLTDW